MLYHINIQITQPLYYYHLCKYTAQTLCCVIGGWPLLLRIGAEREKVGIGATDEMPWSSNVAGVEESVCQSEKDHSRQRESELD